MAVTLFAVTTLSFGMMHAVRGGPFDAERTLPPAIEANLRARYHLDWPLWKQYLHYVGPLNQDEHGPRFLDGDGTRPFGGVLTGDFGPSLKYRDFSVDDILSASLPISASLGALALAWALVVGVGLGIAAALARGTRYDLPLRIVTTAGIAVPNFVIASVGVLVFALILRALPVAGYGSPRHLVLPAFALGAPFAASIARLVRTALLEVLEQDFLRTARAKGLPEHHVILRHALPAALLPVVAYLGPAAAGVLTGSLVVERIFAIPGTGSHFVNSALNRDYPMALGVTVLYTALVCALNVAVDIVSAWLDPRMRSEARA